MNRRASGATESPNDSARRASRPLALRADHLTIRPAEPAGLTHESLPHLHPHLHHLQPSFLPFHKVARRNNHLVTFALIYPMFKREERG